MRFAAAALLLALPITPAHRIAQGDFQVELNELGLLVGVPADGVRTVDGPIQHLREGFAEWYGVAFEGPTGPVVACGEGARSDWAGRPPVELVSFDVRPDGALAVARAGELELRTRFWFDPDGPYLLASVRATNLGASTLRNILYTRESISPGERGFTFPYDIPGLPPTPPELMRAVWMLDDLPPGRSQGLGFSYTPIGASDGFLGTTVPLALWTNSDFPSGLVFGNTNGISFGDYDADGWPDVLALSSGNLWRNVGGSTWQMVADLDMWLPPTGRRYGSSFGDYDADGLADIATEPRNGWGGDECLHLLRNLGPGPSFVDVATDPNIVDVQACNADTETICWGDVDGDQDMDMFMPVYPPWAFGGPGNFFYRSLGPTGPGGAHRFQEFSGPGGFDNPAGSARPEGAQLLDVDFDGDLDLYSNGTLYQNISSVGLPRMQAMTEMGSGIRFSTQLEEGAGFGDHDLDGDYDLYIAYTDTSIGVQIFENRGDGQFFQLEPGLIVSPGIGLGLGLSAEDWDNDGDIDFTTRQVFRQNQFVESGGVRRYTVAPHNIPSNHITSATPAWGDWDRDGDLDCALGNWLSVGRMYENTTYDAATPMDERRYVRVRPVGDSDAVPAGLESEYGASVELLIHGDATGWRRRKFTSSAAGYLNQNEYTLHFALPDDPAPTDPDEDLLFDVVVDFPSLPSQGTWRVDRHVNPILGGVRLVDLAERELVVFRSGKVVIDGVEHPPCASESPLLHTAGGGLRLPDPTGGMPATSPAPGADHYVGIDFDTLGASERVRVRELILDGQLDAPVPCGGGAANLFLWDVTDVTAPALVAALDRATSSRNRRSYFHVDAPLEVDRRYRLVARVTALRDTALVGPGLHPGLRVNGGVSFTDATPCTGAGAAAAPLDPLRFYASFRFGAIGEPQRYCTALPNSTGAACLIDWSGSVSLSANDFVLSASGAVPSQFGLFYYGPQQGQIPFGGGFRCVLGGGLGTFRLTPNVQADPNGDVLRPVDFTQPPANGGAGAITPGSTWNFQLWYRDPTGPGGFNLSDGLSATFCP